MIRFSCPGCGKPLRADPAQAGAAVKCPGCGQKLTIPEPANRANEADKEVETPPEPPSSERRRKRRPKDDKEPAKAKAAILIVACLIVGAQAYDLYSHINGILTIRHFQQQQIELRRAWEEASGKLAKQPQASSKPGITTESSSGIPLSLILRAVLQVGILIASLVLLTFLYLGHDWARLVLGCMLLLNAVWSLYPLVRFLGYMGFFSAFRAAFSGLILFAFRAGPGIYLLKSETVARYTSPR